MDIPEIHSEVNDKASLKYARSLPSLTVIIIDSGRNSKWLEKAIQSVYSSVYPGIIELKVSKNWGIPGFRKKRPGQKMNQVVRRVKTKFTAFLGDDDFIAPGYFAGLMAELVHYQNKNFDPVWITSGYTAIDEDGKYLFKSNDRVQGIFKTSFLKENPFNNKLKRHVDTELHERTLSMEKEWVDVSTNYGYFYRQHPGMISGMKDGKTIKFDER